jgi:hypothetical protein
MAKKIRPFIPKVVLHGTPSFDTLMLFGHPHQKEKNLKSCHSLILLAKFCHYLAIYAFILLFVFAFEVDIFFSLLHTSPLRAPMLFQVVIVRLISSSS